MKVKPPSTPQISPLRYRFGRDDGALWTSEAAKSEGADVLKTNRNITIDGID